MAQKHVSLPRPFECGNVNEWLTRFEICSKANGWDNAVKAVKLPTLLEGEALAVWLDLTEDEQKDYSVTVDKLKTKLAPTGFSSLEAFHTRKLQSGEALSLFVQDLKQTLEYAMPEIDGSAREQLLLHQFLAGLPLTISKQLRATGDVNKLETAVERARLLLSLEAEKGDTASVAATAVKEEKQQVQQLQEQIEQLSTQVAALIQRNPTRRQASGNTQRCFYCDRIGHFQRNCPKRRSDSRRCYACGQLGHLQKDCWQGNYNGAPMSGRGRPFYQ